MLMNLLVVKEGKDIWFTRVHSNYHHLNILKEITDHFRYNFIGNDVGRKNDITAKELMEKIDKIVAPYEIYDWEKGIDLRKREDFEHISGFIIMQLSSDGFGCNELYVDISTTEPDDDLVYERLKIIIKELRKG